MELSVKISIDAKFEPEESNIPGHLDPGHGDDTCRFKVTYPPYPSDDLMSHLLSEECSEWVLTHYDQNSGSGTFISLDFDGPSVGTEIYLTSTKPPPKPCLLVYIREPAHEL